MTQEERETELAYFDSLMYEHLSAVFHHEKMVRSIAGTVNPGYREAHQALSKAARALFDSAVKEYGEFNRKPVGHPPKYYP